MFVIESIAPFFAIILLGFVLLKLRIATDSWQQSFNQFSLYVGFPALIFFYLCSTPIDLKEKLPFILENSILVLSCIVLGWVSGSLLKLSNRSTNTLIICLPFGNIAFLGIPIGTEILGESHTANLSLIAGIYLFWVFLVAVPLIQWNGHKSLGALKEVIKNPLLLATIAGVISSILGISLPPFLEKSFSLLAASVTALVLLSLGIFISSRKLKEFHKPWLALCISGCTLIGMPFLLMVIAYFSSGQVPNIESELLSMMPVAVTPFALADKYELDKNAISVSIVLSTLFLPISLSLLY